MKDKNLEDRGWAEMYEILEREMPQKDRRRGIWWIWGMAALLLGGISLYGMKNKLTSSDLDQRQESPTLQHLDDDEKDDAQHKTEKDFVISESEGSPSEAEVNDASPSSEQTKQRELIAHAPPAQSHENTFRHLEEKSSAPVHSVVQGHVDKTERENSLVIDVSGESNLSNTNEKQQTDGTTEQPAAKEKHLTDNFKASDLEQESGFLPNSALQENRLRSKRVSPLSTRLAALGGTVSDTEISGVEISSPTPIRLNLEAFAGAVALTNFGSIGPEMGLALRLSRGRWSIRTGFSYWQLSSTNRTFSASSASIDRGQVFAVGCPCVDSQEDTEFAQAVSQEQRVEIRTPQLDKYWEVPLEVQFAILPRLGIYGGVAWLNRTAIELSPSADLEAVVSSGNIDLRSAVDIEQVDLFRRSLFAGSIGLTYRLGRFFVDGGMTFASQSHLRYDVADLPSAAGAFASASVRNPLNRIRLRVGYRF